MKIGVCVKQVPARDSPLVPSATEPWILDQDLHFELCEADDYALEAALQLKEQDGGEVVAVSVGPERVKETLRTALAKGADRAVHVSEPDVERLDPLEVAAALAEVARREAFELVLTGLQSDDQGFAQTGALTAELLGIPHATTVVELCLTDGGLLARRELEGGWFQAVTLPLPALIAIQSGIYKPRYTPLKGIMAAKRKELRSLPRADVTPADLVPSQETLRLRVPARTRQTEMLDGGPAEQAAALLDRLRDEARVL